MAFQIRRAHRILPPPQDQIALRTSNHTSRKKVPGTFPALYLVMVLGLGCLFSSSCARVGVIVEGDGGGDNGSVQEPYIYTPDAPNTQPQGPRCQLNGMANRAQGTSLWCWAASAQVIIEYLRGATAISTDIEQCNLVNSVFENELRNRERNIDSPLPAESLHCCKTSELPPSISEPERTYSIESTNVCFKTGWPNQVFDTSAYKHRYSTIYYNPNSTAPQGLGWADLTAQICDNHPFIFAIKWAGGGGHTAVVGGYRQSADFNRWVEVFDPGYSNASYDFYVMRYEAYLGVPGDFTRDRDYINILPQ